MAWLDRRLKNIVDIGKYTRSGEQNAYQEDWLRFTPKDGRNVDNTGWKFHISVINREAQEALAELASEYNIPVFKLSNAALREEFINPTHEYSAKQAGKNAVFYHARIGLDGHPIYWKGFLEEASKVAQQFGIGADVQRDAAVPNCPGIFYRHEQGAFKENYIERIRITDYLEGHGIDEKHAYNLGRLPDLMEEIGMIPKGSSNHIKTQEPDVTESDEFLANLHKNHPIKIESPDKPNHWKKSPPKSNRALKFAALGLMGASALGIAGRGEKIDAPKDQKNVPQLKTDNEPIARASTPSEHYVIEEPIGFSEAMHEAFDKLVQKQHNKKDLGFYVLNERIAADSTIKDNIRIRNSQDPDEVTINSLIAKTRLDKYMPDTSQVSRVQIKEMKHADMPNEADHAQKLVFYDHKNVVLATYTDLPRYQKKENYLGHRSELYIGNHTYVTREENTIERYNEKEVRLLPGNTISLREETEQGETIKTMRPQEVLNPQATDLARQRN